MAQIPKCKHCKQEVLDKSQATKKGSYWYHNSCLEEMERVKKKYKPKDGVASEQQTPIYYKGKMFSIQPKDAAGNRNQFVCCDPNDCQTILWTSGKEDRYGLGPYIIADDKFFILNDDGTLSIAKASTNSFTLLDKAKIIDGIDAWGPLAIADGYLIMRDSKTMVCLDIRKN